MFDMYSTCVQSFKLLLQIVAIVFGTIFWLDFKMTSFLLVEAKTTVPEKASPNKLDSFNFQWPDHFHTMSKVDNLPRHWKRSTYQSFITKTSHQVLQRSEAKQVAMFAQSCSFLSSTKRYNRGDFLHRHPWNFGCLGMNTKTICHQTSNKSSLKGLCQTSISFMMLLHLGWVEYSFAPTSFQTDPNCTGGCHGVLGIQTSNICLQQRCQ